MSGQAAALAQTARVAVARSIELLRKPGPANMEESTARLSEAAGAAVELARWLGRPEGAERGPGLAGELWALTNDLGRVRALLDRALEFRVGRYKAMAAPLGGYSRQGGVSEPDARSGWAVEV